MGSEVLSAIYGLVSAAFWGAGDFSGGIATKRAPVHSVILISQFIGGILLLALIFMFAEPISSTKSVIIGSLAGIFGASGLMALYRGLATGQMGIVAPVSAIIAVILPVIVGIFSDGFPQTQIIIGFGFAFMAVWFLSRGNNQNSIRLQDLKLPIAAGILFGAFFVLIGQVSGTSILWPLFAARTTAVILFGVIAVMRKQAVLPIKRKPLIIIVSAGIFDTGGNAFFALATGVGRLDISAVLSSLYPAITVLLAWLILKERLARQQWVGVIATLIALVLITW